MIEYTQTSDAKIEVTLNAIVLKLEKKYISMAVSGLKIFSSLLEINIENVHIERLFCKLDTMLDIK